MTLAYSLITPTFRCLIRVLCRVDDGQVARVPDQGPLILVTNHVNFVEVPLLYTHLMPRRLVAFAKAETWDNPALGFLMNLWGAIPLRRGEADVDALREGLRALEQGFILGVAPEGTRSGTGQLQSGQPGIAFLAMRSRAPILPLACYGQEGFWDNMRVLRRTPVRIVVGEPFSVESGGRRVTHEMRLQMAGEIMYQLAALLPPANRGVYSDLSQATERHLRFAPGAHSNLRDAAAGFG